MKKPDLGPVQSWERSYVGRCHRRRLAADQAQRRLGTNYSELSFTTLNYAPPSAAVSDQSSRPSSNRLMSISSKSAIMSNVVAYACQSSFVVPAIEITGTCNPLLPQKSEY